MGRVGTSDKPLKTNCTLVSKNQTWMVVMCSGTNVTLKRPTSPSVEVMLSSQNRSRCSGAGNFACQASPRYFHSNGSEVTPEVSYGELWRIAPARLLARDLRFRLCGNGTDCPQARHWTLSTFWQDMMANGLLPTSTKTSVNQMFESVGPDPPNAAWDEPWMLCTTNSSGKTCSGTISKNDWLAPDRKTKCMRVMDQPNAPSAAVGVNICNLDSRMDRLCSVVQHARYQIFEANCQLTGQCLSSAFFYQPATYSIDDSRFVRSTVGYFYNFTSPGSCPVQDQETLDILSQNQQTAQNCAATDLQALQYAIQMAREVLHLLVKMMYYFAFILFDVIQLIGSTDTTSLLNNINYYWNKMLSEFNDFFKTLGDLAYKMIMETGKLGQALKQIILTVCEFLSATFMGVVKPLICFIKDAIITIMETFSTIIDKLSSFLGGALGGFSTSVKTATDNMRSNFDCNMQNPFGCKELFPSDGDMPSHLPMPTRCWAGYLDSAGDSSSLGCSGADTCVQEDGSLGACASCPMPFGCSALTKLCSCNVVPISRSQCSSNEECYRPDVGCNFVDRYLNPSYGSVPCSACTARPICLVASGSIGTCSCEMIPVTTMQCTNLAQRVLPDPTAACLVSLGLTSSSSASYTADYHALAVAPCSAINAAQSYCLTVFTTATSWSNMVVGLALLSGRRRLLTDGSVTINQTVWVNGPEPCSSLMLETGHLGPVDRYTKGECERWASIGAVAVSRFNLSISPIAFTSWQAMGQALSANPEAGRKVASQLLTLGPFLVAHLEAATPILAVATHVITMLKPAWNATHAYLTSRIVSIPGNVTRQVEILLPWFKGGVVNDTAAGGRRLLSWKSNLEEVQTFSINIASGQDSFIPVDIQQQWNKGPFFWPPTYHYWDSDNPCLAGEIILNASLFTFQATADFYTGNYNRPTVARSFKECVPTIRTPSVSSITQVPSSILDLIQRVVTWIGTIPSTVEQYKQSVVMNPSWSPFDVMLPLVSWTGFEPASVAEYASNGFSTDARSMIICDFKTVQHCSQYKRSVWWSLLAVAIGFAIVSFMGRQLGIPFVDTFLMFMYFPTVFAWSMGVSPLCAPMVPTCLISEITDAMDDIFPLSFEWSNQLQKWPGCVKGNLPYLDNGNVDAMLLQQATPGTPGCMRSCFEWPFEYQTWEDSVAWASLELGVNTSSLPEYSQFLQSNFPYLGTLSRLQRALDIKQSFLQWPEMVGAQRFCASVTALNVVPAVLGLVLVTIFVLSLAAIPFMLIQFSVSLILGLLQFVHTR